MQLANTDGGRAMLTQQARGRRAARLTQQAAELRQGFAEQGAGVG